MKLHQVNRQVVEADKTCGAQVEMNILSSSTARGEESAISAKWQWSLHCHHVGTKEVGSCEGHGQGL